MKKNKKVSLPKKPFVVFSRKSIAGWLAVIFVICAWMFVIGLLVGRGTAPVKFDVDGLHTKLEISRQDFQNKQKGRDSGGSDIVKDKTKLDFYEALPEDRDDTKIDEKKSIPVISKKVDPPPAEKPPKTTGEKTPKKSTLKKASGKKTESVKKQPAKAPARQPVASKSGIQPSDKVYTVQVAALKAAKDADRLVARLKKKGYPAYRTISKVQDKGIWFRVRVGKYNRKADARVIQQKLIKAGMQPIVVEK